MFCKVKSPQLLLLLFISTTVFLYGMCVSTIKRKKTQQVLNMLFDAGKSTENVRCPVPQWTKRSLNDEESITPKAS